MAIPMANMNVPAAGRGVLATQGVAPVLAARGNGTAGAPAGPADAFGIALQAEAVDGADTAELVEAGDADALADTVVTGEIELLEDGDASDAERGRRDQHAASDESAAPVPVLTTAPAMQSLPRAFHTGGQMRTTSANGDIALRLDGASDATNVRHAFVQAPVLRTGGAAEATTNAEATLPLPASPHGLPTSIALPNGMTLNTQPLLQVATNGLGGLATSNAARNSLVEQLGDRLQVQIAQRSEHAVIRLDPPSMGRIEILITQEAGNTQVQMRASNPEVARQLHAIGEQLRQDLVQRQHGDVSVQVQDGWREADGRGRQRQSQQMAGREEPGHGLRDEDTDEGEAARFALQS